MSKDYEVAKNIRVRFLTMCIESHFQKDEKSITDIIQEIKKMKGFNPIDPSTFTKEECIYLGFKYWDEKQELLLVPFWMLPFLVESFKGSFIGEDPFLENITVSQDEDHRFGTLPYGVFFENNRKDEK